MEEPIKPDEGDCCNSGCNPCILDVYEQQLSKYRNSLLLTSREINKETVSCIKPTNYSVFKLVSIEQHTPTTFFYTFDYVEQLRKKDNTLRPVRLVYEPSQHFLLKGTSCDKILISANKSFTRAYTPIPPGPGPGPDDWGEKRFKILVRLYDDGLMSAYLRQMKLNDTSLWRGPYGDFRINYDFRHVLLIAQGTGIAPLYSVICEMLQNDECDSFLMLFFCCRSGDDVLLHDELYRLSSHWNFNYELFFSSSNDDQYVPKYNETCRGRRLQSDDIESFIRNKNCSNAVRVLVCGNDSFARVIRQFTLDCDVPEINIHVF